MKTELKGREVLKVQALPGQFPYKSEGELKGEFYRRFTYGGKAFVANVKDAFCKAFDEGNVYSVDLDSNTDDQLAIVGHTTIKQELNMVKTEVMLSAFTVENFVAGKVGNYEELIAL